MEPVDRGETSGSGCQVGRPLGGNLVSGVSRRVFKGGPAALAIGCTANCRIRQERDPAGLRCVTAASFPGADGPVLAGARGPRLVWRAHTAIAQPLFWHDYWARRSKLSINSEVYTALHNMENPCECAHCREQVHRQARVGRQRQHHIQRIVALSNARHIRGSRGRDVRMVRYLQKGSRAADGQQSASCHDGIQSRTYRSSHASSMRQPLYLLFTITVSALSSGCMQVAARVW